MAVIAPERQVRGYELTGGDAWPPIDAPTDPNALTFQPQGRLLTLCRLGQPDVQILDVPSRRIVRTLPHPLGVFSVGWHPDGKLLAVPCADFQVYLWNVETGRLQTTLRGHQSEVVGAVFNHRGLITSGDSGLQHWPVRYDAAHGRWSVGPPQTLGPPAGVPPTGDPGFGLGPPALPPV